MYNKEVGLEPYGIERICSCDELNDIHKIMYKKEIIRKEYEFDISDRKSQIPGLTLPYIDIFKYDDKVIKDFYPIGVYDIIEKEFILFDLDKRKNDKIIKSNEFFDQIEKFYYMAYQDVELIN